MTAQETLDSRDVARSNKVSPAGLSNLKHFAFVLGPWVQLMRVSYFAGTLVAFWPYAWAVTMSARAISMSTNKLHFFLVVGYVAGFLSHSKLVPYSVVSLLHSRVALGAGCIWNDILDRDFDAQVERTKNRPIPSGRVSVSTAFLFACCHLVPLLWMIWKSNNLTWNVGLLAIFLTGVYPLMKRITYWPQAWLGVTVNIGIHLAWAVATATIPTPAIALHMGCFFWTLWYDTIYACQDWKDDVKAGVKSTALLFGSRVKQVLSLFGVLFLCGLATAGALNSQSIPFYVVAVLGSGINLGWQLWIVNVNSPESCWKAFTSNGVFLGLIVEVGLIMDYYYLV